MLMTEKLYVLATIDAEVLYGTNRSNLALLRHLFPSLRIVAGENVIKILGEERKIEELVKVLDLLVAHVERYSGLSEDEVRRIAQGEELNTPPPLHHILYGARGKSIVAKGPHQQEMLKAFSEKTYSLL